MTTKQLLQLAAKAADPASIMTSEERANALDAIRKASEKGDGSPWWVVLLKVLAYAIGLILAGYGTTAAAQTLIGI